MGKVEGENVVMKKLVVVVEVCCAKVKREGGCAMVLAHTMLNFVGSEVLQGWMHKEKVFRH